MYITSAGLEEVQELVVDLVRVPALEHLNELERGLDVVRLGLGLRL
jgi:hypothetical protein